MDLEINTINVRHFLSTHYEKCLPKSCTLSRQHHRLTLPCQEQYRVRELKR